jgi:putative heme-binding domain-containing protein
MVRRVKRSPGDGLTLLASVAIGLCGLSAASAGEPARSLPTAESVAWMPRAQQFADLPHGRTLYIAHCGRCHGMDGGGGEGPRLAVAELQQAQDVETLQGLIRRGVPGTAMRGLWQISGDDVRDIAAYVWSLGRNEVAVAELPGDPDEGAALYASMNCSSCHIIGGQGGTMGPVLTRIGLRRGIDHLREALVDPGAALPENSDPAAAGSIYLLISVQTRDGRRITGTRVNEDTFTLQIRDEEDAFHSIRKEDIVSLQRRFGESLMPSYADTVNDEGIDALVAYLATLKGES